MDKALFWRAALIQAAGIAILSGILIALPLGDDFFDDYGIVVGPIAWVACSVITALILKLPWSLAVFAACCGGYEAAQREMAADGEPGAP